MKVPFFELKRQYENISKEVEEAVVEVMRSGQYVEGSATKKFETELAEYLDVKHVITCGNGTDALKIALQACGIGQGDEVITTSFSFFATAEAIAQVGAIPIFADIDQQTLNISVESLESLISDKTKAIIPVHIFGLPADMKEINKIANEKGIPVIEDACQGIGAEYQGKKVGSLGTLGCFSFYPTKNLGGMGDGGAISTNDDDLAKACRAYKAHAAGKIGAETYTYIFHESVPELEGMKVSENSLYDPCKYYNYFIGENSRLDSMQAAVLSCKLKRLAEYNNNRYKIAKAYTEGLHHLPIQIPILNYSDRKSCWHQYAVLCEEKEDFIKYMAEKNIGVGAFYPVPLHLQKAFKDLGYTEGTLLVTEQVCRKSVCLPIFPEITQDELSYVIDAINGFYR